MTTPYPNDPISPLRARMIDDMRVRNFSLATQRGYIRGVKMLAAYLRRSPDTATADEIRSFQRHLAANGITPGVQNMTVSGLRFFFQFTVDKPDTTRHLVYTHQPQKLPRVLSFVKTTTWALRARIGATPNHTTITPISSCRSTMAWCFCAWSNASTAIPSLRPSWKACRKLSP